MDIVVEKSRFHKVSKNKSLKREWECQREEIMRKKEREKKIKPWNSKWKTVTNEPSKNPPKRSNQANFHNPRSTIPSAPFRRPTTKKNYKYLFYYWSFE